MTQRGIHGEKAGWRATVGVGRGSGANFRRKRGKGDLGALGARLAPIYSNGAGGGKSGGGCPGAWGPGGGNGEKKEGGRDA